MKPKIGQFPAKRNSRQAWLLRIVILLAGHDFAGARWLDVPWDMDENHKIVRYELIDWNDKKTGEYIWEVRVWTPAVSLNPKPKDVPL